MSEKIDVHGILYPPTEEGGATPQGEMRHFVQLLDEQIDRGNHEPNAMVLFGASKGALIRIRAAMLCGCDALDVLQAVKEAN
jgi:hypothetical protein